MLELEQYESHWEPPGWNELKEAKTLFAFWWSTCLATETSCDG
jgi:hypothetical protein